MINHEFAICINNHGYEASLEPRKLYEVILDPSAAKHSQLRIIDESGEDYLYPETFFDRIALPENIATRVFQARAKQGAQADWP
jgi:hypothetical protein